MSKLSKAVNSNGVLRKADTVTNYMGGSNFTVDPMTTLRMVTASSIFGEAAYYERSSLKSKSNKSYDISGEFIWGDNVRTSMVRESIYSDCVFGGDIGVSLVKDRVAGMERVIDEALNYDFLATLKWAVVLRLDYNIRLNPQIIMVRAAIHPKRAEFTLAHPSKFSAINQQVMYRADDCLSQMAYYLYKNDGSKRNIPSILKRSWCVRMSNLSEYQLYKYKNSEIGMINGVRLCHAHSKVIDQIMRYGKIDLIENKYTWENLRSAGKSWDYIFKTLGMGHMALLRNMRGFLSETNNLELTMQYMEKLKSGVKGGRQFPFRYYTAYMAIKNSADIKFKHLALSTLEECINISVESMPKLKGKTMCLSDNSGSAWEAIPTEYGSVTIAEIDNLSAVITAYCSSNGYVGKFGSHIRVYHISKQRGILEQALEINEERGRDVGLSTEGGIWEFFNTALCGEHWDNIFIYSDQQAGYAGLYGDYEQTVDMTASGYAYDRYIDVYKLILAYRSKVNPKVNVFSIQTAGYDNAVVPDYFYRTNLLYGWTGKESLFASLIISEWDRYDKQVQSRA